MDSPPPSPPRTTTLTVTVPTIPAYNTKLRLMCSYGGHIVPRPQTNSLFYAGGDTRIITLDYRTTAASLSALASHLSRTLFNQRPFHLKYQLPGEDLDSLVSVINDEDFHNMLEEHDRVNGSVGCNSPSRIRLFLFPVKPDPIGSVLVDRKSDSWFSDALNNTGIIQRVQCTKKDPGREFSGQDNVGRLDSNVTLPAQQDNLKNVPDIAGDNGGESNAVHDRSESVVLNTSLSFGSTNSLVSMANLPAIGVQPEGNAVGSLDNKIRVPSSVSVESDNGDVNLNVPSKKETHPEQLTQAVSGVPSFNGEIENPNTDPSSTKAMQKAVQSSEYHLPQHTEGKHLQYEQVPYTSGGLPYPNQYSTGQLSLAGYYPIYPLPSQNQVHNPYFLNQPQPYPVYFVPVRPNPNCNMSIDQGSLSDNNGNVEAPSRPPLHPPHNGVDQTPRSYNEVMITQHMPESTSMTNHPLSSMAPFVLAPLPQPPKQQFAELPELSRPS